MSSSHPALVIVSATVPDDLRLSRLEALLDPVFLAEARWDAEQALLRPSPDHRLLGWSHCSVPGCTVETSKQLCNGCRRRQAESGLSPGQFIASAPAKKHGGAEGRWLFDERLCLVEGCQRPMHARTMGLCNSHTLRCRDLFGRRDPADVPLFLERSDVRAFPSWGPCRVAACLRLAYNGAGLCLLHSQRWHETLRRHVDADLVEWCRREDGVTVPVSRTSAVCHGRLCSSSSAAYNCAPVRAGRLGLLKRIVSPGPHDTNRSPACAISTWTASAKT
jgi:hypothetical protein